MAQSITIFDQAGVSRKIKINSDDEIVVESQVSQDISNGVSISFSKVTANSDTFPIQKGQLNKLRLRPQIINEHAESSRNVIGLVTSSNIVGQIFKASQDNINGINMTFESNTAVSVDNFESYADDAALRAVWVLTGTNQNNLETGIVAPGGSTKSMNLPMDKAGDIWINTVTPVDLTGYTAILQGYFTAIHNDMQLSMVLGDGANTKRFLLVQGININNWITFTVNEAAFTEDGATDVDMTAITQLAFTVTKKKAAGNVYIDNITHAPPPGSVNLSLFDMGTTIPTSLVTSLDDGTQYTNLGDAGITGFQEATVNVQLEGGKRIYHVDGFVAGVALEIDTNELLIPDHYYAITVNYVDTNINVYGPNPNLEDAPYYNNGYSFTTPDTSTAITATGDNEDLMFVVFSTQDVYISKFIQAVDATPNGGSSTSIFIEDFNMKITDIIISGVQGLSFVEQDSPRPFYMVKGSKFEQYYNDDFTDLVTAISLTMAYFFEPNTPHG